MTNVICLPASGLSSHTFHPFPRRPQNKIPSPPGTKEVKAFIPAPFLQLFLLTLTLAVLYSPQPASFLFILDVSVQKPFLQKAISDNPATPQARAFLYMFPWKYVLIPYTAYIVYFWRASAHRLTRLNTKCRLPTEASMITEMLYVCAVQYGSRQLGVSM